MRLSAAARLRSARFTGFREDQVERVKNALLDGYKYGYLRGAPKKLTTLNLVFNFWKTQEEFSAKELDEARKRALAEIG